MEDAFIAIVLEARDKTAGKSREGSP